MNQNIPFKLFSCCHPVKGFSRSVICDTQRNSFDFIPNSLYDILVKYDGYKISEIKSIFNYEFDNIIDDYFIFLQKKEYIFFTEEPDAFPFIKNESDTSSTITNIIISDTFFTHNYNIIINQIDHLNVKAIQYRFFEKISLKNFNSLLTLTSSGKVNDIELIIKKNKNISLQDYKVLYDKYPRLSRILIHSSENNKSIFLDENNHFPLLFISKRINDNNFCGNIHPNNFSINFQTFIEALNYNSCLYKKISIDENGEIKNCPSMKKSYGNIRSTSLIDVLDKTEFKNYWYKNKDNISVCNECEFKYICTDCRAFIKNPENIYSQPAKCYYNPYLAKWKGQEGYMSIKEWEESNLPID
ncbi:MAG: grasp-with-spasm system SPASM domain peptide maturase [Candidatus Woesearchaeota archaeon]